MLALFIALSIGQCGAGGCLSPSFGGGQVFRPMIVIPDAKAPVPSAVRPVLRWHWVNHENLVFPVFGTVNPKNGNIIWDQNDDRNRESWRKAFSEAIDKSTKDETEAERPVAKPTTVAVKNFGIDLRQMNHSKSPYTAHSEAARRFVEEAYAPVVAGDKFHVTVIGTDDARDPVINDMNTHEAFADLKHKLLIQGYKPNDWPVDPSLGFKVNGKPTIVVQTAKGPGDAKGGRVVYMARDYSMGPIKLAEAIRKADPNYKPSLTPDGLRPGTCPIGFTQEHWPYIAGVGLLVFIVFQLPERRVAL